MVRTIPIVLLTVQALINFNNGEIFDLNQIQGFEGINANPVPETTNYLNAADMDTEFDFIIVGAGSAGSVIANRLSEVGTWKILVLEEGLVEGVLNEYPAMTALLQFTDYYRRYEAEPQAHACLAIENQRCPLPTGKALGGSSSVSLTVFTRGNPEDYNRWAALGNPGWSYPEVLPYFLKSEDAHLNDSDKAYHGRGGYLSTENTALSEFGATFIAAGLELHYKYIDPNGPAQIGFSRLQVNTKQGRRHSTSSAFLLPVLHRDNLRILTGARVTKILIDSLTKTAFGVEYIWANTTFIVKASKEVILCAGALSSPQLLMLSGVGPRSHLDEFGIVALSDLPVGQTLYEHVSFSGFIITTNLALGATGDLNPLSFLQFYNSGEGPLSSIGGYEALAFINTYISKEKGYPDIELLFGVGSLRADNGTIGRRLIGISQDYYNQMYTPPGNTTEFMMEVSLLHPKSTGFMKLRSGNPYDFPLFYTNYFTDPQNQDIKTMVAAVRTISRLFETRAFRRYNTQILRKPFVRCEHLPFDSDEHWECAIRLLPRSSYHPTSTCKMGPPNDATAVVNHEIKVYGINRLRVADASVIPVTLSAHTNAAAVMIGEKASDIIKKEWGVLSH